MSMLSAVVSLVCTALNVGLCIGYVAGKNRR
jgi:hypothetical protein